MRRAIIATLTLVLTAGYVDVSFAESKAELGCIHIPTFDDRMRCYEGVRDAAEWVLANAESERRLRAAEERREEANSMLREMEERARAAETNRGNDRERERIAAANTTGGGGGTGACKGIPESKGVREVVCKAIRHLAQTNAQIRELDCRPGSNDFLPCMEKQAAIVEAQVPLRQALGWFYQNAATPKQHLRIAEYLQEREHVPADVVGAAQSPNCKGVQGHSAFTECYRKEERERERIAAANAARGGGGGSVGSTDAICRGVAGQSYRKGVAGGDHCLSSLACAKAIKLAEARIATAAANKAECNRLRSDGVQENTSMSWEAMFVAAVASEGIKAVQSCATTAPANCAEFVRNEIRNLCPTYTSAMKQVQQLTNDGGRSFSVERQGQRAFEDDGGCPNFSSSVAKTPRKPQRRPTRPVCEQICPSDGSRCMTVCENVQY